MVIAMLVTVSSIAPVAPTKIAPAKSEVTMAIGAIRAADPACFFTSRSPRFSCLSSSLRLFGSFEPEGSLNPKTIVVLCGSVVGHGCLQWKHTGMCVKMSCKYRSVGVVSWRTYFPRVFRALGSLETLPSGGTKPGNLLQPQHCGTKSMLTTAAVFILYTTPVTFMDTSGSKATRYF